MNELNYPKQDEGIIIEKNINLELKEVVNFPIDAVFTWVNDNDPAWKEKLYKYKDINLSERGAFSSDMARFNNHDELKYSVESILKNLKWIRKIFIITDNQVPNWYIEEDEKFKKLLLLIIIKLLTNNIFRHLTHMLSKLIYII
nr:Stealth CR1 domain-containing protein [Pantoea sp. Seng]